MNADGYAKVSSVALDPIEKSPCIISTPVVPFCRLEDVVQLPMLLLSELAYISNGTGNKYIEPKRLVDMAIEYDSVGIAFTYNEPVIWYEYVLDTARLCKERV